MILHLTKLFAIIAILALDVLCELREYLPTDATNQPPAEVAVIETPSGMGEMDMQTNPMQMAWKEYRDQIRLFGTKPTNFGNLLKQCHRRFRAERQQAETNAAFAAADAAKFNREMRAYRAAPQHVRTQIDAAREQLAFRKTGMLSGNHGKDIAALEARIDALLFPAAETIPSTQIQAA